ncbi:MAG: helix-turn-helix domain-containing protein [Gordonia sp. (in: high G+C Gram-positive bacteria)]|uniref:helix-turn-helix domain-containing protein n=1 Tax=Gordonia sp. (in: high G+C Gram-positive bacteria) TaxID=84139 RepID=UPI0039E2E844
MSPPVLDRSVEAASPPEPEIWSVADALAHGWAYSTVYRHLRHGLVPSAAKVGREWRFERAELEALRSPSPGAQPAVDQLSDPVREWARRQAADAPPMRLDEARVVVALFTRTAGERVGGAAGSRATAHDIT